MKLDEKGFMILLLRAWLYPRSLVGRIPPIGINYSSTILVSCHFCTLLFIFDISDTIMISTLY